MRTGRLLTERVGNSKGGTSHLGDIGEDMQCYECKWPTLQRARGGQLCCPRCGAKGEAGQSSESVSGEQPSTVVKIYVGAFGFFLLFPFLIPALIKFSLANP